MNITVRPALYSEREQINHLQPLGCSRLFELKKYWEVYFPLRDTREVPRLTLRPEEVAVITLDGRFVGYVHFFTDPYGGDGATIKSLAFVDAFPHETQIQIDEEIERYLSQQDYCC